MPKVEDLLISLKNSDWEERYLSAKKLGELGETRHSKYLIPLLNDSNRNVRVAAAVALGKIQDKSVVETLITALADPNIWVRLQIVEALGKIHDSSVALILAQFIENESNERVKATIIKVLGQLGDPKTIPMILSYLKDGDIRIRANAVEALELLGYDKLSNVLTPLIDDSNHRMKANIAKALHMSGDPRGLSMLRKMINDENELTRAAAAWAMGEIGSETTIKNLINSLGDEAWFVDKNIVKALLKMGNKALRPMISQLRKEEIPPRSRASLCRALGEMGDRRATKVLIEMSQHDFGVIRGAAEEALDILRSRADKSSEV